jgi:hypothetical protein
MGDEGRATAAARGRSPGDNVGTADVATSAEEAVANGPAATPVREGREQKICSWQPSGAVAGGTVDDWGFGEIKDLKRLLRLLGLSDQDFAVAAEYDEEERLIADRRASSKSGPLGDVTGPCGPTSGSRASTTELDRAQRCQRRFRVHLQ